MKFLNVVLQSDQLGSVFGLRRHVTQYDVITCAYSSIEKAAASSCVVNQCFNEFIGAVNQILPH